MTTTATQPNWGRLYRLNVGICTGLFAVAMATHDAPNADSRTRLACIAMMTLASISAFLSVPLDRSQPDPSTPTHPAVVALLAVQSACFDALALAFVAALALNYTSWPLFYSLIGLLIAGLITGAAGLAVMTATRHHTNTPA